ncbi:MAG: Crp/Fnr family transcriptional regulator [Roseivirga sp.]|nr:Crp/Fnr family transcriptional regulator [Roseivirga sp.]
MSELHSSAKTILKSYTDRYVKLSEEESEALWNALTYRKIARKEYLLEPGQTCKSQYFILEGCFRTYYIDQKGNEQIMHFAIEHWWMTDYDSLNNQQPSEMFIQALEPAVILQIDLDALNNLFDQYPKIDRLFRIIAEKTFIAAQRRLQHMLSLRREEMLDTFQAGSFSFSDRVPQYMIASYLGFTPEFLSMIRAKKRNEKK